MKKKLFVLSLVLGLLCFVYTAFADTKIIEPMADVPVNKSFKIGFNSEIDKNVFSKIKVKDSKGNFVTANYEMGLDRKSVFVRPPEKYWSIGETYELFVDTKTPVSMYFTITNKKMDDTLFKDYLNKNYLKVQFDGVDTLFLDKIYIDNLDYVGVYFSTSGPSFGTDLEVWKSNKKLFKNTFNTWLSAVIQLCKVQYPNKQIKGCVAFQHSTDTLPTNLNSNDYKYNSSTGKYDITMIVMYTDTSTGTFTWHRIFATE